MSASDDAKALLVQRKRVILGMIYQAVAAGERCPTNPEMAAAIGAKSISTPSRIVALLEEDGAIQVERIGRDSRVVTIVATGKATRRPDAPQPSTWTKRTEQLAELVAEGMEVEEAGRKLGLFRSHAWMMWKKICRRMGEPVRDPAISWMH